MRCAALLLLLHSMLQGQGPRSVLVVANEASPLSQRIAEYYLRVRSIPLANLCRLHTSKEETVTRAVYEQEIEHPVAMFLRTRGLAHQILYIVTTQGVPLRVRGTTSSLSADGAAVDSELTLLYPKLLGERFATAGPVPNPYFGSSREFQHPSNRLYLVTRLAGYDFGDIRNLLDRALEARNRGKVILDLKADNNASGNDWLRRAARLLPEGRVILDASASVLYDQRDVIGYASWGSNDPNRKRRFTGFQWLPGAIATQYVSTDGRSFARPPDTWNLSTWNKPADYFAGSPQSLTSDCIHEGATGCSGHIDEPYLQFTPRPDHLLPNYLNGRNLAESFYSAIPALSWQNIVVGDPLTRLRP
ncbi:MAG: TIGR03790 family protein [Bryobacteraceae bacterium]